MKNHFRHRDFWRWCLVFGRRMCWV